MCCPHLYLLQSFRRSAAESTGVLSMRSEETRQHTHSLNTSLLSKTPGVTGKFGLGIRNEAGQRLIEFCQENALVITNTLFQQHKRRLYTWTSPDGQHRNQMFFAAKDGEALYSQQKQDQELTVAQIMNSLMPNSDLN